MEIIPAIDIIGGKCVRLTKGDYDAKTEYRESPVDMVRRFVDHGFQRIHVVDLDGAKAGRPINLNVLEKMASISYSKIEWGGGLKTDQDIIDAFNAGASYQVIGSIAALKPQLFKRWLDEYGPDRMVLGADAKNGKIAVSGWLEETGIDIDQLISEFDGLTQAIVTDIACDGMLQGPSYDLYEALQKKFPDIIFTVSGGVSSIHDIERLQHLGLPRVIVGKAIYEGHIALNDLELFNTGVC